jgi:membrane protein
MNRAFDLRAIQDYYFQRVWQDALDAMPGYRQKFIVALRIAHLVIRDLMDGMITLRAMGLVYTTMLALVPLLAVSFSVLKGFGVHNQVEPVLLNLLQPLGDKGVEISERIIAFVDNTRTGVLGSLGLVLLLYTVVSLLQKIEKAFNFTWRVTQQRSMTRRFSDYLSLILIGPVLLFTALGMTASLSSITFIQQAMETEVLGPMFQLLAWLLPYVLVIAAFTFIYMLVPNIRVNLRSALVGGLVAGILWETTSWAFAAFVVNSAKYTAIYSAFAALIIFFIWIYMNWLILLVGCSIASYHQQPAHRNLRAQALRLSNRLRESLALMIMMLVAQHYHYHQQAWTLQALAQRLNVDLQVCELLVNRLQSAGLLLASDDTPSHYLPAYDPATMMLEDIIDAVRRAGENDYLSFERLHRENSVDTVYRDMEAAMYASLQGKSLLDLARKEEEKS